MRPFAAILAGFIAAFLMCVPAEAHIGAGLAVDRDGRIYFTDPMRNCIWRVETDGTTALHASDVHCNAIAAGADGSVLASVGGVIRIEPNGTRRQPLAIPDADNGGAFVLAIGSDSSTLVLQSNHSINLVQVDGVIRFIASIDDSTMQTIKDENGHVRDLAAAIARDGSITLLIGSELMHVAADSSEQRSQLNLTGSGRIIQPLGASIGADGAMLVADYGNRRTCRIASDGTVTELPRSGWPWRPVAVVDHDGSTYVLERWGDYVTMPPIPGFVMDVIGTPRVRRIDPDGSATTFAAIVSVRSRFVVAAGILVLGWLIVLGLQRLRRRSARRKQAPRMSSSAA